MEPLSRRLSRPIHLAALASLCCLASACGGSQTTPASGGHVSLPPGFPLPAGSLSVQSLSGTTSVSANGGFTVPDTGGSPALALVEDASGDVVLMGFVDDKSADNPIGTLESAEALLFVALGGFTLPVGVWPDLLAALRTQPATNDLANELSTLLPAHATALADGDAEATAAIQSAQRQLTTMAKSMLTAKLEKRAIPTAPEALALLIRPSAEQNGATLLEATQPGAVQVMNRIRRHGELRIYETAYTTLDDSAMTTLTQLTSPQAITPPAPPADMNGTVTIASTQNIGSLFGLVAQIVNVYVNSYPGTPGGPASAFTPTYTEPWGLALDGTPNATQTSFVAVVLGGSFNWTLGAGDDPTTWAPNPQPPLASDDRFQPLLKELYEQAKTYSVNAFFFDLLLPLLNTATGANSLDDPTQIYAIDPVVMIVDELQSQPATGQDSLFDALANRFNATFGTSFQGNTLVPATAIKALLLKGNWSAVTEFMMGALKLNPAVRTTVLQIMSHGSITPAKGSLLEKIAKTNGLLTAANALLGTADLAAVVKDLTGANAIDSWTIEAIKPKVFLRANGQLDPTTVTVDPTRLDDPNNALITLVATSPATGQLSDLESLPSAVAYHWTLAGNAGGLLLYQNRNGNNGQGTTVDTPLPSVQYETGGSNAFPSVGQSDTVTVEMYLTVPSSGAGPPVKQKIGSRSTTIQLQSTQVSLSPPTATIAAGDTRTFQVTTTAPAQDRFTYSWTSLGWGTLSDGTQSASSLQTTSGSVSYAVPATLDAEAIDMITVDVYRLDAQNQTHYLGEAAASVTLRPLPCSGPLPDSTFTWCNPGTTVSPGPSHQNTGSIRSLARRGAVVTDERRDGQVGQVRDERSLFGAMALGPRPSGPGWNPFSICPTGFRRTTPLDACSQRSIRRRFRRHFVIG